MPFLPVSIFRFRFKPADNGWFMLRSLGRRAQWIGNSFMILRKLPAEASFDTKIPSRHEVIER